ncbi:MAG: YbjP/YqhG family protein [Alistipes sp.]|nr:YbjP/YqhG family protein [Alistipes sp.]
MTVKFQYPGNIAPVIIAAIFAIMTAAGCRNNAAVASCRDSAERIGSFYTEYIETWLADEEDFEARRQAVLERYVAQSLLDRLHSSQLDFDPFLQAQDCDRSVLEKLTVERCADRDNACRIALWDEFNRQYRIVILEIDADGMISGIDGMFR